MTRTRTHVQTRVYLSLGRIMKYGYKANLAFQNCTKELNRDSSM